MNKETRIAIVTGATSGFGEAIAAKLATEGWDLVITGRRAGRLEQLAQELSAIHGIKVKSLCFDVRNYQEVSDAFASLEDEWRNPEVLINNAGLALGKDPVQNGDLNQWEQMIDTNLKGMLYVTRMVVPMMIKGANGTIINIGSIAGKEAYAGGNVYSASKFAVDGLTKNMRIDLLPHNIRVAQIVPGAAETEFSLVRFGGDSSKAKAVYNGFIPLNATDIAEAAWFIVSRPAHVCINELIIMPTAQANATTFHRES
jgi:3-hydroxy acid dehydrogenase/malonic semialdehyde reductase